MNISLIATLAAVAYILLTIGAQMLRSRKRSWVMAVIRISITVFCALISIPVTRLVAKKLSSLGLELLAPTFGEGLQDYISRVPVGAEGVRALVSILVSPILYLLIFLVLRFILTFAAWIVGLCVPALRERTHREISLPVAAANGLLFALITLVPLCGYLTLCSHLLDATVEAGVIRSPMMQDVLSDDMTEDDVLALADELGGHPVVAVVHGTVGRPIFSAVTTTKLDPETTHGKTVKINLERELSGFVVTMARVMEAADTFGKEDYTLEDKQKLLDAADSLFTSEWISIMASDTVVAMADSWLNNQSFLGMERPEVDANLNPTVNKFLEVLRSENAETLPDDIHLILSVVGDLKVYGLLDNKADYETLAQRMGQGGLLTRVLDELRASERLSVIADELEALSIRLVSSMLGVDKLKDGEYAETMDKIASKLTDSLELDEAERDAMVVDAIQTNLKAVGYDVPEDVALKLANQAMNEMGEDGEITADELTDYLVNHAGDAFEIVGDVEDLLP
ncbi:MAG: hypothetical protein IKM33_01300 [Clostridia bacterium]|nr:hypothetical protein [Clostridia bacterium]